MELSFNELSSTPLSESKYKANERMILFSKTIAEARKNGFRKIRSNSSTAEIVLAENYSLHDWLFDNDFPPEYRHVFYDMFTQPFIKENDENIVDEYIESYYYFEDLENSIHRQQCLGLASAYLTETLSVSLQNNSAWLKNLLQIIIEKSGVSTTGDVCHVYSKECFDKECINEFVEKASVLVLQETDLHPSQKNTHLTSHHGQKELGELWSRIKKSPYIIGAISVEWGGNSFCKNPQKNGKIDIVCLKSDRRYTLQVQTTGRNLRETQAIAEILEEMYFC